MPPSTADRLTKELRAFLAGFPGVRLALLFGSRARGSAHPSSDLDIAVDAPSVDIATLSAALSQRFEVEVDIVRLDEATIPLLDALIQEGVVVHEARAGLGAQWRSHVLLDLETDRVWYGRMRDAWLRKVASRGL